MTEETNRRVVKPANTLIDESGFGYEEGAIYSSKKAANELGEPDAWLVPWCRANGDAGTNVYVKESDAENAAKNLVKYSRSETTADVIPLYAANHLPTLPQPVSDCPEYRDDAVDWSPQRETAATGPGLKVELAARNLRILGLEKSLDDAVVALQGILLHPGDKESWEDANKVLPSLLRMLDRHEFEEAGFDTCRHCGERKGHNVHATSPLTRPESK